MKSALSSLIFLSSFFVLFSSIFLGLASYASDFGSFNFFLSTTFVWEQPIFYFGLFFEGLNIKIQKIIFFHF